MKWLLLDDFPFAYQFGNQTTKIDWLIHVCRNKKWILYSLSSHSDYICIKSVTIKLVWLNEVFLAWIVIRFSDSDSKKFNESTLGNVEIDTELIGLVKLSNLMFDKLNFAKKMSLSNSFADFCFYKKWLQQILLIFILVNVFLEWVCNVAARECSLGRMVGYWCWQYYLLLAKQKDPYWEPSCRQSQVEKFDKKWVWNPLILIECIW
jgi:hypothetical protein